jgi:phosphoribosylaminoimidazolecarboxamide formyltransferase/IMP cyclohydrolase
LATFAAIMTLMGINTVEKIDHLVPVNTVLISVSDKSGLDAFIPKLVAVNPELRILSTGGTFNTIREILGDRAGGMLMQVSDYTGQPETQGGLVKTLDFKIYLGILTETYNSFHQADLRRTDASAIDMVIVNLYPFRETIAKPGATVEMARGNIDIGGPCMVRASAKNYLRVASVVDPADYTTIIRELESNSGQTTLETRFRLAQKAFAHTADYDRAIAEYLGRQSMADVAPCYGL